jgi:hypothetical protein
MKEKASNIKINLKIWSDLVSKLRCSLNNFEKEFETRKEKYLEEANELAKDIDSSYCANITKLGKSNFYRLTFLINCYIIIIYLHTDYVVRWEASKLEQQNLRLSLQEEFVLNQIKELEKKKTIDARVSEEIRSYQQSVINTYKDEILAWKIYFNEEVNRRQIETTELEVLY